MVDGILHKQWKISQVKQITVFVCLGLSSLVVLRETLAYEPPRYTPEVALTVGLVAFRGRVVKSAEIQRDSRSTLATTEIEIEECLFGSGCKRGSSIHLDYYAQTEAEGWFPVRFDVSREVLVIMRSGSLLKTHMNFCSNVEGDADLAFLGYLQPRLDESQAATSYESVYGGPEVEVRYDDLRKWAAERRRGLLESPSK